MTDLKVYSAHNEEKSTVEMLVGDNGDKTFEISITEYGEYKGSRFESMLFEVDDIPTIVAKLQEIYKRAKED